MHQPMAKAKSWPLVALGGGLLALALAYAAVSLPLAASGALLVALWLAVGLLAVQVSFLEKMALATLVLVTVSTEFIHLASGGDLPWLYSFQGPLLGLNVLEYVLGTMLFVAALRWLAGNFSLLRSSFDVPLLIFLGLFVVAYGQSIVFLGRFDKFYEIRRLFYLAVAYFFCVSLVKTQKQFRLLVDTLLVAIGIKGVLGVVRYFAKSFGADIGPGLFPGWAESAFFLFFMGCALGFVLFRVSGSEATITRFFFAPVLFSFIFSYRRTFWVAALIALVVSLSLLPGRLWRRVAWTFGMVTASAVGLILLLGRGSFMLGMVKGVLAPASGVSGFYRLVEYRNVLATIREHPLLGIGVGREWEVRIPLPEALGWQVDPVGTHNTYLWVLLKIGLVGLAVFGWLMFKFARSTVIGYRTSPPGARKGIVFGIFFAMAGVLAASMTAPMLAEMKSCFFLGLLMGIVCLVENGLAPALATSPTARDERRDGAS